MCRKQNGRPCAIACLWRKRAPGPPSGLCCAWCWIWSSGRGDTLVVCKLARLARHLLDLCTIATQLKAKDAKREVLDQPMERTSPVGALLCQVLGALAQFALALR